MAYTNKMTRLLDKIEGNLGTDAYNLPEQWAKDKWVDKVIDLYTLDTFSRYFPNMITHQFNTKLMKYDPVDKYYIFNEEEIGSDVEIIGLQDIPWTDPQAFGSGSAYMNGMGGYGILDTYPSNMGYEDFIDIQCMANEMSLMNRNIYIDFKPPNRVKLTSSLGMDSPALGVTEFKLNVLVKHHKNLTTIEPSKMEIFERLATADVAKWLYNKLKYYDGLETVFANVELHLQELQDEANKREDVIQEMKEGYVSMANKNQMMILTI